LILPAVEAAQAASHVIARLGQFTIFASADKPP
jgi:hypothetical protein